MTFPPMIQQMDFQILDWIQANLRTEWMDWLMPKITSVGNAGIIWILVTVLCLLRKPYRRCGITMIAGFIGYLLIGQLLLKNLIARARPCWIKPGIDMLIAVPGDYSFPSGHTCMGITAAAVLLRYDRRFGIPALVLAVMIAFSRLYVYVHFPTDVLAGAALGILMAFLAEKLADWLQERQMKSGKQPSEID